MIKKILIIALCVIQLAVPSAMIAMGTMREAAILNNGREYTFDLDSLEYSAGSGKSSPVVTFSVTGWDKADYGDKLYIVTAADGVSFLSGDKPAGAQDSDTIDTKRLANSEKLNVTRDFEDLFPGSENKNNIYLSSGYQYGFTRDEPETEAPEDSGSQTGQGFQIGGSYHRFCAVGRVYEGGVIFTGLLMDGKALDCVISK